MRPKALETILFLRDHLHQEVDIRSIASGSKIPYTTIFELLQELESLGVVSRNKKGKKHVYALNFDSKTTHSLLYFVNQAEAEKTLKPTQNPSVAQVLGQGGSFCSLNGKPLIVSTNRTPNSPEGITFEDLRRNIASKPELLRELVVFEGFDGVFNALKKARKTASERTIEEKRERIQNLRMKVKQELDSFESLVGEGKVNEAISSLYKAVEHSSNELAVFEDRKTSRQNLSVLSSKNPELKASVESIRKAYEKSRAGTSGIEDVKESFDKASLVLSFVNSKTSA